MGLIIWKHSSKSWTPQYEVNQIWPEWESNFSKEVTMLAVTITPFFFSAASLYKIMPQVVADTPAELLNSKSFAMFQNTALFSKSVMDLKPDKPGSVVIFRLYAVCVFASGTCLLFYCFGHAVYLMVIHEVSFLFTLGFFVYIMVSRLANWIAMMWWAANYMLIKDVLTTWRQSVFCVVIIAFFAIQRWMDAGFRVAVSPPPPGAPPLPPKFPPEPPPPACPPHPPQQPWQRLDARGVFLAELNVLTNLDDSQLIVPVPVYAFVMVCSFFLLACACIHGDSKIQATLCCFAIVMTPIGFIAAPTLVGDDPFLPDFIWRPLFGLGVFFAPTG